ncbi:MAG: tetratricopeptide repeat protein [Rikenellaceae bacterium]
MKTKLKLTIAALLLAAIGTTTTAEAKSRPTHSIYPLMRATVATAVAVDVALTSATYIAAVSDRRRAAQNRDVLKLLTLGDNFYYGIGVPVNHKFAAECYLDAAFLGDAAAQERIATCYYNGHGVSRNDKKAMHYYQLSAEQGYVPAINGLGNCYRYGRGVAKDHYEAIALYHFAAEQGYWDAQNNLAWCYAHNIGTTRDYAEAAYWYSLAAEQGYAQAQYLLGNCYYLGTGVERDYSMAAYWFNAAAAQGHRDAINRLNTMRNLTLRTITAPLRILAPNPNIAPFRRPSVIVIPGAVSKPKVQQKYVAPKPTATTKPTTNSTSSSKSDKKSSEKSSSSKKKR